VSSAVKPTIAMWILVYSLMGVQNGGYRGKKISILKVKEKSSNKDNSLSKNNEYN